MIRLTPIASATSSTARRRMNAPRSSSSRMARCLSSRDSVRQRRAELALDGLDQPVERTVQRRACARRRPPRPPTCSGRSPGSRSGSGHQLRAERLDDRLARRGPAGGAGSGVTTAPLAVAAAAGRRRRAACSVTCVAPLANAAARTAPATSPARSLGTRARSSRTDRTRRVAPSASAAATADITCGPGWPSTNGSMVNSSTSTRRIVAGACPARPVSAAARTAARRGGDQPAPITRCSSVERVMQSLAGGVERLVRGA